MSAVALPPGRTVARRRALPAPAAAWTAAALSFAVAWVHFAYFESHWESWWAYGLFFVAMGLGQGLFVPAILRWPTPWMALIGIVGNLAIVGMYVLSRTAGVPLGPHAGVVENAGAVDLATTAVEIAIIGVLLTMVGQRVRMLAINAMLLSGATLWVLRLTDLLP